MKIKVQIVCIILLCLIAACKKKNTSTPINPELEKYFSYKPGTYWIYKDSVRGTIDSFVCYHTNTTDVEISGNLPSATEETDLFYIYGNGITVYSNGNSSSGGGWNLYENNLGFGFTLYDSVHCSYFPLCQFPFQPIGYVSPLNYGQYSIVNYLPKINVSGNLYDSVTVINEYDYGDLLYINTTAGIIKIRYNHPPDTFILELQRYHIIH